MPVLTRAGVASGGKMADSSPVSGKPTTGQGSSSSDAGEVLGVALVVLLAVLVGVLFHRVFGLADVLVPTVVAAIVPAGVTVALVRSARVPALLSVTACAAVGLVLGGVAYARDEMWAGIIPSPGALGTVAGALFDAPREILTTVLPASGTPESRVLVPASVWVASALGVELALRTGSVVLPVVPATVLALGTVLLATGAPGASMPLIAAFAVVAGSVLAARGPGGRPARAGLAAGLALVLAIPAALLAPRLPGAARHAFDPRGHVSAPEPMTVRGPSPLSYVSAWLQQPDTPLFSAAGPTRPDGTLFRLAALDHYDGVTWAPGDRFMPTGGRVPGPPHDASRLGAPASHAITIGELPGVFLPAPERPLRVDEAPGKVAVDADRGALAAARPLQPGVAYRVTSRPVEHDPRSVEFAPAGHTADALALPDRDAAGDFIPALDELRRVAQEATAGASFPYQQALRLAAWLRGHAVTDPFAVPGHSYRHIQYFLGTSKQGTSEQFATAFALMARTLALPARVVVGFRAGAAPGPDGRVQVRGGDVLVWAEVEFEGAGWVPFFPTPGVGSATSAVAPPTEDAPDPLPVPAAPAPPAASGPPEQPSRDDLDRAIEDRPHAPAGAARTDAGQPLGTGEVLALIGLLLVVAYIVAALTAPALLRRHRTHGTPPHRIAGAWAQALDDLTRAGPRPRPGPTADELVTHAATHLGAPAATAIRHIAESADAVAFGARPATPELADACAKSAEDLRTHARQTRTRRARAQSIAARLSPTAVVHTVTLLIRGRRARASAAV